MSAIKASNSSSLSSSKFVIFEEHTHKKNPLRETFQSLSDSNWLLMDPSKNERGLSTITNLILITDSANNKTLLIKSSQHRFSVFKTWAVIIDCLREDFPKTELRWTGSLFGFEPWLVDFLVVCGPLMNCQYQNIGKRQRNYLPWS